jgi:hypothetical protein
MKVRDLVDILIRLNPDAEIISSPEDYMVHREKYSFYDSVGWIEEKTHIQMIDSIKDFEKNEDYTTAINILYDYIDSFITNDGFKECDKFIDIFLIYDFSFKINLSFLTITNRVKDKLEKRNELFKKAKELAFSQYKDEKVVNSVLYGLN